MEHLIFYINYNICKWCSSLLLQSYLNVQPHGFLLVSFNNLNFRDFYGNRISYLNNGLFNSLTTLIELTFNGNWINAIQANLLDSLTNLQQL